MELKTKVKVNVCMSTLWNLCWLQTRLTESQCDVEQYINEMLLPLQMWFKWMLTLYIKHRLHLWHIQLMLRYPRSFFKNSAVELCCGLVITYKNVRIGQVQKFRFQLHVNVK